MSNPTLNTETSSDKHLGALKAVLYLLQTHLEEFKDEVDQSYELLKIGERTEFSKRIEQTIKDPLGNLGNLASNIDEQVKQIIDRFVQNFFKLNKEIISQAYRSKTSLNDLHYSIVLKDDNIENRVRIFEFLNKLDLTDLLVKYPVYFQFVPVELVDKINYVEELKFD